jgi:hypothetical protein
LDDARNAAAAGHIHVNTDIASGVVHGSGLVNDNAGAAAEIMPYWYTTSQWRLQFPNDKVCKTITLKSIKSGVTPKPKHQGLP